MENNNSYSQFLKQENELTKLKIQAEFGFQLAGESSLNPAIENVWLKQILDFERTMANSEKITIGEKLGHPVFKPFLEIPPDELQAELHLVMETLHKKNLVLDSVAGASDVELYKFITEELMLEETDSCSPPNMMTCFIYEEFHPNHEYDIRNRGDDFISGLEREDYDFSFLLSAESDDEIHEIRYQQLLRRLQLFKDAFDEVKVNAYKVTSVNINNEKAEIIFHYNLSVLPCQSKKSHTIKGEGMLTLKYTDEWWSIVDIIMKGVV